MMIEIGVQPLFQRKKYSRPAGNFFPIVQLNGFRRVPPMANVPSAFHEIIHLQYREDERIRSKFIT